MANELNRLRAQASADVEFRVIDAEKRLVRAIYTHCGTNGNGLDLVPEEARKACEKSAGGNLRMPKGRIEGPADLHPTDAGSIIGEIEKYEFADGPRPRVEFEAVVDDETEHDRKAWKLIKRGVNSQGKSGLAHVSYEIDYAEGECSKCGNRFTKASEICSHLAVRKGMICGTSRGSVIMHGVVFKGASIFEQKGGDPDAVVLAVANLIPREEGEMPEELKEKEVLSAEAAKATEIKGLQAKVDELESENNALKAENKSLKDANEQYEGEKKSARVEKIVQAWEARGAVFDEKARKAKTEELAAKSDESLSDMENVLESIPVVSNGAADEAPAEEYAPKSEASARSAKAKLSATAAKTPASVGDGDQSANSVLGDFIKAKKEARR